MKNNIWKVTLMQGKKKICMFYSQKSDKAEHYLFNVFLWNLETALTR